MMAQRPPAHPSRDYLPISDRPARSASAADCFGGRAAHRITRAIRWLKDHFDEPLSVEALAKRVGLRPSAFHLHFERVTALSPLQFQKRLRLHEARRLMLAEGLEAADAAFRVGYESPSRFSRENRRTFGAPPRQDVAR